MRGGGEVTATGKENRNAPMLSPPFYHFLPLRIHTHTARPLYTQGALQINGRMLTTFDVLHKRGHRGSHDATCNNWNPPPPSLRFLTSPPLALPVLAQGKKRHEVHWLGEAGTSSAERGKTICRWAVKTSQHYAWLGFLTQSHVRAVTGLEYEKKKLFCFSLSIKHHWLYFNHRILFRSLLIKLE